MPETVEVLPAEPAPKSTTGKNFFLVLSSERRVSMSAQWNLVLRMLVNRVNSQGLWTERQLRLVKSQRTNEIMRKMALDFTS